MSHLLQMRGLKLNANRMVSKYFFVASFTDAWIETFTTDPLLPETQRRIFYRCVD